MPKNTIDYNIIDIIQLDYSVESLKDGFVERDLKLGSKYLKMCVIFYTLIA